MGYAMELLRKKAFWGIGLSIALVIGVATVLVDQPRSSEASPGGDPAAGEEQSPGDSVVEVKTIRPRRNLPVYMEVQEPADVEPFYRADLASRVAGVVKSVTKDVGDRVHKGEVLIEVDVPDRVQDVYEMETIVIQRIRELDMARARVKVRNAAVKAAEENVKHKQALVVVADAEKAWRKDDWERYIILNKGGSVTEDVVVEKKKCYLVADAGTVAARVDVKKANADLEEEKAKSEEADADVNLKQSRIEVARQQRDKAQVLLDYAKIRAEFDGVIIRRDIAPGSFVQNAATGSPKSLMSVVRTDIVTLVMKVPDTYAPYVTRDTEAIIQIRGRLIKARVTRYSPSIHEQDRTMRVEVDLYNGTREGYQKFLLKGMSDFLAPVGLPNATQAMTLLAAGRSSWGDNMKGSMDPFPAMPEKRVSEFGRNSRGLLPRMYGQMKLRLQNFQDAYLIPNSAVFSLGGKKYIMIVKEGKAYRVPVEVPVSDARLAKVAIIGELEVRKELTGKEVIIASDQSEISDGQAVHAQAMDWPVPARAGGPKP
jgi:multidrug efflux pump subunit AcrA (membrane-fusion protein)